MVNRELFRCKMMPMNIGRCCLVLICGVAFTLPSRSQSKPRFDKTEWALLTGDASSRALDVYSTHWAQSVGNREALLPGFIANRTSTMALYSGGVVAAQYLIARTLFRHHHQGWAHIITGADIAVDAPFAIHNLFIPACVGASASTALGCQSPPGPPIPIPNLFQLHVHVGGVPVKAVEQ